MNSLVRELFMVAILSSWKNESGFVIAWYWSSSYSVSFIMPLIAVIMLPLIFLGGETSYPSIEVWLLNFLFIQDIIKF